MAKRQVVELPNPSVVVDEAYLVTVSALAGPSHLLWAISPLSFSASLRSEGVWLHLGPLHYLCLEYIYYKNPSRYRLQ